MYFDIFALILLVIPYVSTFSPLSLTKPITDGFGVNIHFTPPLDGEMTMLAAAGFKWVRLDLRWDVTEQKKGEYNFENFELLISEIEKHNLSAIVILDYGNQLYDQPKAVLTEEGRKAYAKWAATAVDHFKGKGILWEIWNEPNVPMFWNNKPDVNQYISMELEAVKAIRAKTPKEVMIGPALGFFKLDFLEDCFKAGLLEYWDAVSIHPYRETKPETVSSDYVNLKKMIARFAPKGKTIPIISGEWGYSAAHAHFNSVIQGKYLPRQFLTNVLNGIPVSIWFEWRNGPDIHNGGQNFGIVEHEYHAGKNPVYTPKDAYLSAKTMASVLKGYHFAKRIATNDTNDYVMVFSNGQDLRMAVWTASPQPSQIKIPSDNCDFEIIDYKGDKQEKTSATDGSLKLTLYDSPQYYIIKGPNHAIDIAPDANLYYLADIMPSNGKTLHVRVSNLYQTTSNVTLHLTDVKGIEPIKTELYYQFNNEYEKVIEFPLKSKSINEYTVGLLIESHGALQNFQTHTYHLLPDHFIATASFSPSADSKAKGGHTISVGSAPKPLLDSDSTVLKIDYNFLSNGSKYFEIYPNKNESHEISGEPKTIGMWIYGDKQMMTIRMRIKDSSHQTFQLQPQSQFIIDWEGWNYILFNLNGAEHFGGSNDGKFHYPLEWSSLFLLDNNRHIDVKSTIYITTPVIIY